MSLTVGDVQAAKTRDELVPGYAEWIRQFRRGDVAQKTKGR